ncbi:hypothetical protein COCNU_02G019640 [Cocos nucifera]|uniref:Uncharacterized protein n=1 Tax=Cocos nucifera TaxID=13894 RepID=A0A8K0I1A8_COCNU|nr:hypothetical protein COCNU_02G019640 [Cocos nucifera]
MENLSTSQIVVLALLMFLGAFHLPYPFYPFKRMSQALQEIKKENKKRWSPVGNLLLSQISSIVVFIIIICIMERKNLIRDPLNFSTSNVIFQVTSGYGNAGLSMGHSCSRFLLLHPDEDCQDRSYSFSGTWSDLILAIVMLYGWLKNSTKENGKAWKLPNQRIGAVFRPKLDPNYLRSSPKPDPKPAQPSPTSFGQPRPTSVPTDARRKKAAKLRI